MNETGFDVAIIGAGPAGIAAALELKKQGITNIIILERNSEAGGNPRYCGHSPFGMQEFKRIYLGPRYAKELRIRAENHGIRIATKTTVIRLESGGLLTLSSPEGSSQLQAKKVIISTGIRETPRSARLVSGQRPNGIMTTGALQSMVYTGQPLPFKKPVIIGTELVSFSAVASCRHASITPVAMLEENSSITAQSMLQLYPKILGTSIDLNTSLLEIIGKEKVSSVKAVNADGTIREIECDGVIFSGKFLPEASLARSAHLEIDPKTQGPIIDQYDRCSDPDYFATGNVLRPVETGGWCWQEGVQTARHVAQSLKGQLPSITRQIPISIAHPSIKYVIPQRFSLTSNAHDSELKTPLQIRFNQIAKGTLSLNGNGFELRSKRVNTKEERRVLLSGISFNNKNIERLYLDFKNR